MASIDYRETKKGLRYRAQVRMQGVVKYRTFPTEKEARDWADALEDRIKRHKYRPTIEQRKMDLEPLLGILPTRVLSALSEIPYELRDILEVAIPFKAGPGVYFLIKSKDVIYVGQSAVDCLGRIVKHRREGKVFDSYVILPCSVDKLDALEAQYITALVPKLNYSLGRKKDVSLYDCPKTDLDL